MTPANRGKAIARELEKARQSLKSAELLAGAGDPDGSINRAYYAIFHAARAALATLGIQPRTHVEVNRRFNLDLVVPGAVEPAFYSILGRVQSRRETADYDIDVKFPIEQGATEVAEAKRFVARIEAFLTAGGWSS